MINVAAMKWKKGAIFERWRDGAARHCGRCARLRRGRCTFPTKVWAALPPFSPFSPSLHLRRFTLNPAVFSALKSDADYDPDAPHVRGIRACAAYVQQCLAQLQKVYRRAAAWGRARGRGRGADC